MMRPPLTSIVLQTIWIAWLFSLDATSAALERLPVAVQGDERATTFHWLLVHLLRHRRGMEVLPFIASQCYASTQLWHAALLVSLCIDGLSSFAALEQSSTPSREPSPALRDALSNWTQLHTQLDDVAFLRAQCASLSTVFREPSQSPTSTNQATSAAATTETSLIPVQASAADFSVQRFDTGVRLALLLLGTVLIAGG